MFNFIKSWFLKRKLAKEKKKSQILKDLDFLILEELKEVRKNTNLHQKLLKYRMASQIKDEQMQEMEEAVTGNTVEEEPTSDFEEMIGKQIIEGLMKGKEPKTQTFEDGEVAVLEQKAKDAGVPLSAIDKVKKKYGLLD